MEEPQEFITVDTKEQLSWLARFPWTRAHGGLDLLGEMCLVAAAVAAFATLGPVALPYLIASMGIIPDMIHSVACLIWGDGSHASAERSRQLAASGTGYVDPQDRYNNSLKALKQVVMHYSGSAPLSDEALAIARNESRYVLRMMNPFYGLKYHPNETGRLYEGAGKITQTVMGTSAAIAFNPVGGTLQALSGALNTGAVVADLLPESDDQTSGLVAHFRRNNQKYSAGMQLAATAMYIPAAIAFGITTPVGMALMGAVVFWGIGYGAKFFATKRGYAID